MLDYIDYIRHRKNIYSQFGEDGILEHIFKDLSIETGVCVEIGAGDGLEYSNTRHLLEQGWSGVWIEGDEGKYAKSIANAEGLDVTSIFNMVPPKQLDKVIPPNIPEEFELLVIDIDGDDWLMWKHLINYRPKIVMVECNYSFPYNVEFVQREGLRLGASALAMYRLSIEKGYMMICYNVTNSIFMNVTQGIPVWMLEHFRHHSFTRLYGKGSTQLPYFCNDYDGFLYTFGKWDNSGRTILPQSKLEQCASIFKIYENDEMDWLW